MTQENTQPKKKKWYFSKWALVAYAVIFLLIIIAGITGEPTTQPKPKATSPTRATERPQGQPEPTLSR